MRFSFMRFNDSFAQFGERTGRFFRAINPAAAAATISSGAGVVRRARVREFTCPYHEARPEMAPVFGLFRQGNSAPFRQNVDAARSESLYQSNSAPLKCFDDNKTREPH